MPALDECPVATAIEPRPDGVDIPFWEGLKKGELHMQQCAQCRTWWWAPVWHCSNCGSWEFDWPEVPKRGIVYSWVRTHQPFVPAMASIVPYVTVLVELPDAGNTRIFGILVESEEGLDIGSKVTGVIQPASELTRGMPILRWRLEEW